MNDVSGNEGHIHDVSRDASRSEVYTAAQFLDPDPQLKRSTRSSATAEKQRVPIYRLAG